MLSSAGQQLSIYMWAALQSNCASCLHNLAFSLCLVLRLCGNGALKVSCTVCDTTLLTLIQDLVTRLDAVDASG
jgi:hypothetical protein